MIDQKSHLKMSIFKRSHTNHIHPQKCNLSTEVINAASFALANGESGVEEEPRSVSGFLLVDTVSKGLFCLRFIHISC